MEICAQGRRWEGGKEGKVIGEDLLFFISDAGHIGKIDVPQGGAEYCTLEYFGSDLASETEDRSEH